MDRDYEQASRVAQAIRARVGASPAIGIVLGSGLGDLIGEIEGSTIIPYAELPGWPVPSVSGHAGRLVLGRLEGREVALLSGRVHYYEGHPMAAVTFATRVIGLLGVRHLILTNAAGGIRTSFSPGALMVVDDHLNLMGTNPLIGPNDERVGARFPDMSEVYSARLRMLADTVGAALDVDLAHGVYAAVHGPSFETPAEIRYLRTIGADAVGMSTVPEAIVARHMGLEVLALSCITNMAAGMRSRTLSHAEVMETTARVRERFGRVLAGIVRAL